MASTDKSTSGPIGVGETGQIIIHIGPLERAACDLKALAATTGNRKANISLSYSKGDVAAQLQELARALDAVRDELVQFYNLSADAVQNIGDRFTEADLDASSLIGSLSIFQMNLPGMRTNQSGTGNETEVSSND